MLHRCYGLGPRSRLVEKEGKKYLVCTHPLRRFEVNEAAWLALQVLDGITPLHELVKEPARDLVNFLEHKVDAGLLQASYHAQEPLEWPRVAVIVPAYGNLPGLRRCLASLAGQHYPREQYTVTVVDDATPFSLLDELRGVDFAGLTTSWLHLKNNMGPATARNSGAGVFSVPVPERTSLSAASEAPAHLLAFVDSDCVPAADWLKSVVPFLQDPLIAAAGGGVTGLSRQGLLARYESACASLNMGARAGAAGLPESRIPYLPACNLIVKRSVFNALSGFGHGMRLGEDVDFCWRLTAAGHGLFYSPGGLVFHDYRARWLTFLNRKREYAFSESWLRRRHQLHFSARGRGVFIVTLLIAGAALAIGRPEGLAVAVTPWLWARIVAAGRNRRALRLARPLAAMAAVARASAAEWLQQCRWLLRYTLVMWLPALAVLPRLAPLAVFVAALAMAGEWMARRPKLPVWVFLVGYAGDCLAYSLGRLQGELHAMGKKLWMGHRAP